MITGERRGRRLVDLPSHRAEEYGSAEELVQESGLDAAAVDASLLRLDHNLLISRTGSEARVLSIGESLIKCQAKYDNELPYIIEDGVIKARKK